MTSSGRALASLLLLLLLATPASAQDAPADTAAKAAAAQAKLYPESGRKSEEGVSPGGCGGKAQPDLKAIRTAEGLVIAPDGTFYFTQPFGRAAPASSAATSRPTPPPSCSGWISAARRSGSRTTRSAASFTWVTRPQSCWRCCWPTARW